MRSNSVIRNSETLQISVFCDSHRLCEIAGLIHIEAPQDCQMIAEELQRHNVDDWLQAVS